MLKLEDVFPTILHVLDINIPKDVDGKVIKEIFDEDSVFFKKKIKYSSAEEEKTQKEKDMIKKTISKLNL